MLESAVQIGDLEAVKRMISAGADVNISCTRFGSCLIRAVLEGQTGLVKTLCAAGARGDVRMATGRNALHIALKRNSYIEIVKELVNINAPLNVVDIKGESPVFRGLCVASEEYIKQWLDLVLNAGYRVSKQDYDKASERFPGSAVDKQLGLHLENPRSLKELCCFKIREILGHDVTRKVDCLPLPRVCKVFLKLQQ